MLHNLSDIVLCLMWLFVLRVAYSSVCLNFGSCTIMSSSCKEHEMKMPLSHVPFWLLFNIFSCLEHDKLTSFCSFVWNHIFAGNNNNSVATGIEGKNDPVCGWAWPSNYHHVTISALRKQ